MMAAGWEDHRLVMVRMLYLMSVRLAVWMVLLARSPAAKNTERLMLRQELVMTAPSGSGPVGPENPVMLPDLDVRIIAAHAERYRQHDRSESPGRGQLHGHRTIQRSSSKTAFISACIPFA